MRPPAPLLEAAEARWGSPIRPRWASGPHSEAAVWALHGHSDAAPPVAWLKVHRHRGKVDAEQRAHCQWLPAAGLEGAWLDRLTDTAFLLAHRPGRPLSDPGRSSEARARAWRALGRAIRALHELPWRDDDPMPLAEAWRRREAGWLARGRGLLPEALLDACRARMEAPLPPLVRAPCHRDLRPDNVIVGPGGELSLLDFGQSRPDCAVADWVKLFECPSTLPEGCQRAFEAGYGVDAGRIAEGMLPRARLLHGLATTVWARQKGDRLGAERGMSILSMCMT